MNLIKKLLKQHDTKKLYLMKDIYFVVDFSNKSIIPIVYNDDYSSILRLDKMQICESKNVDNPSDKFNYVPSYIIKKNKNSKSYTSFLHNNEECEINLIATKMLFADNQENMDFLNDIQILNSNELEAKYNLAKKYKNFKQHVYSHDIAYVSQEELLNVINFILKSKIFKNEVESFYNRKRSVNSRSF